MSRIKKIIPREILNGGGQPTIEIAVLLSDGSLGIASAPSGGVDVSYEAAEFSPGDSSVMDAPSIIKALDNVANIISPALVDKDAERQQEIDKTLIELDGTQNKGNLGANTILAVSMAVAKASAVSKTMPLFMYLGQFIKDREKMKLPTPLFGLINGGKQNGNNIDFSEFLAIPASSKDYSQSLKIGMAIYNSLKKNFTAANVPVLTTSRGAFAPALPSNYEACAILKKSIEETSLKYNLDVFMGVNAAANNFRFQDDYKIKDKNTYLSTDELIAFYMQLSKDFNLLYLEDPLSEEDWESWSRLSSQMSQETIISGDDLTATNIYRLQMALNKKALTATVLKPNQIGTVIEALAFSETAHAAGIKTVVSHRTYETNDNFIADFAVATGAEYVKFGAPQRGENVSKYNRLLQIEKQLQNVQ